MTSHTQRLTGKQQPRRLKRCGLLWLLWMVSGLIFNITVSSSSFAAGVAIDPELRDSLKAAVEASDSFEDRFDAEVWLLSKQEALARFVPDHRQRLDLLRKIHRAAKQADLQPEVVLAVIEVESHFNRFAISRVGAQGMMQVMPFWKNEIGRPEDNLTDVDTNLRYGCAILKHYMKRANGRLMDALARYNGSYGEYWYPQRVMDAWERNWR